MDSIYLVINQCPGFDSIIICYTRRTVRVEILPRHLLALAVDSLAKFVGQEADRGHLSQLSE
jgi:hypothetical protein